MLHLKKNDTVKVITGKDKGKTGKVLKLDPSARKAIVQGINFATRHLRKKRQDQEGGIMHREAAISVSNLAVVCKGCGRTTRVGFEALSDGSKSRFCKKCKEVL
ncbi:MAG: 50S ribosomal protein L24 [Candidatus Omnitrophica bacterium]|jgi:large subunit ribosomal protein L24|nr:50S ribosomal protein L24 [Candidatus Omnitrophota bacterium]